jgi:dUTP pyrophosphatase
MEVKFKKLHPDSVLPSYSKAGDAGLDITAIDSGSFFNSVEGERVWYFVEYGTGLSVEIPEGYVGLIFPRSSISKKLQIQANAVGVIDSGFRGEVKVRYKMDFISDRHANPAKFEKGDRIAQLIVLPYPAIEPIWGEELTETERGDGGFGSTGN